MEKFLLFKKTVESWQTTEKKEKQGFHYDMERVSEPSRTPKSDALKKSSEKVWKQTRVKKHENKSMSAYAEKQTEKKARETIHKITHQAANDNDANSKENWKLPSEFITNIDVSY